MDQTRAKELSWYEGPTENKGIISVKIQRTVLEEGGQLKHLAFWKRQGRFRYTGCSYT